MRNFPESVRHNSLSLARWGLFCFITVFLLSSASFAVPQSINIQGVLAGGTLPTYLTFGIWKGGTADSGGELVWTDIRRIITSGTPNSSSVLIDPTTRIFNIVLGPNSNVTTSPPFPEFTSAEPFFLQIMVGTTPLLPRQQLVSVPFAITSKHLVGGMVAAYGPVNAIYGAGAAGYGVTGAGGGDNGGGVYGVYPHSPATTDDLTPGRTQFGVAGKSYIGTGVYGIGRWGGFFESNADQSGVYGTSARGFGVYGHSEGGSSVAGIRGSGASNTRGLWGSSSENEGVYGWSTGLAAEEIAGVRGHNERTTSGGPGVRGTSRSGIGVIGRGGTIGVLGTTASPTDPGVKAENTYGGPALQVGNGRILVDTNDTLPIASFTSPYLTINKAVGSFRMVSSSTRTYCIIYNSYVKARSKIFLQVQNSPIDFITSYGYSAWTSGVTDGWFKVYLNPPLNIGDSVTVNFLVIN